MEIDGTTLAVIGAVVTAAVGAAVNAARQTRAGVEEARAEPRTVPIELAKAIGDMRVISSRFETYAEQMRAFSARLETLSVEVAALKHRDEEHSRNVERFWAQNWPRVEAALEDFERRLTRVETKVDQ